MAGIIIGSTPRRLTILEIVCACKAINNKSIQYHKLLHTVQVLHWAIFCNNNKNGIDDDKHSKTHFINFHKIVIFWLYWKFIIANVSIQNIIHNRYLSRLFLFYYLIVFNPITLVWVGAYNLNFIIINLLFLTILEQVAIVCLVYKSQNRCSKICWHQRFSTINSCLLGY